MKRARADHPVMKLNVGGKRFEVASETLAGMPFFEPMLQGRFPIAKDEDGHAVFIDRCGDLFSILLQAHRTMQRPDQSLLDLHKTALLTECEYYGADHVAAMIRGETNPYHLRHEDRAIRQEEIAGNASLIDVFGTTFTDHHSEELQVPLLFKRGEIEMPRPCASVTTFERHFRTTCGPAADALLKIPDIVFAGSSILSAFLDEGADECFPPSDIDIFLVCDDPAKGEATFRLVYEALQGTPAERSRLLVLRSNAAVTLFRGNGTPVQLVLHVYKSVAQLLSSFDVDCCCIAYDPVARQLWCTRPALLFVLARRQWPTPSTSGAEKRRCKRAIEYRANIFDTRFLNHSYTARLEKYAKRGTGAVGPLFWAPLDSYTKHTSEALLSEYLGSMKRRLASDF